ncbi:MAG: hypothetical protein K6E51_09445 [Treponema sp.]|nr:hypothetical protein [Treponema sp.]
MKQKLSGKNVLQALADRYYQLYITPASGMSSSPLYKAIVARGEVPDEISGVLKTFPDGFTGCEYDQLFMIDTPVGEIEGVYLYTRSDFERFIQVLAYKCEDKTVPPTMGSCAIMGITNWRKIEAHKKKFFDDGGFALQWFNEFERFTADKKNYQDRIIVISRGNYSAVPASAVNIEENTWLDKSMTIRLYHESTHIICRDRFPKQKHAVWDELLADCIGLTAAFGFYDRTVALRLLGIDARGEYIGGRLENYLAPGQTIADLLPDVFAWTSYLEAALSHDRDVQNQDESLFEVCLSLESTFWKEVYHGSK